MMQSNFCSNISIEFISSFISQRKRFLWKTVDAKYFAGGLKTGLTDFYVLSETHDLGF